MYKLYKIVNKINNHIYIGMTKLTIEKRFSVHKSCVKSLNKTTKLYNAMRSYGVENFEIFLINTFKDKISCEKAEIETIKELGYYNMAEGGSGGFVISNIKEWKEKLSIKRKGRTPALGLTHTKENKELFKKVSKKYWETQKTYKWEDFKHLTHKEAKIQFGISTTHYYRLKNGLTINEVK
jgi:group I intron endonuclease